MNNQSKASKANIIFIMSDQHRYDMTSAHHPELLQTPAMDSIKKEGAEIKRMYTPNPVCVPTRYAIFSSRSLRGMKSLYYWSRPNPYIRYLGHPFNEAGYQTLYFGKHHLREPAQRMGFELEPTYTPDNEFPNPKILKNNVYSPVERGPGANAKKVLESGAGDSPMLERDKQWEEKFFEYFDRHEKELKNPERPFMAVLGLIAPHDPYRCDARELEKKIEHIKANMPERLSRLPYENQWLQDYFDRYTGQVPSEEEQIRTLAAYLVMTEKVDSIVARVKSWLNKTGLLENTYLIYTSDHGDMCGDRDLWGKELMYEPSVRVPFFIQGPGIPASTVLENPSSSLDIAPTLLGLCNVQAENEWEGKDLSAPVKAHQAEGESGRRMIVSEIYADQGEGHPCTMLLNWPYKYVNYPQDNQAELYNLVDDPRETNNLINQNDSKGIVSEFQNELQALPDPVDWLYGPNPQIIAE